MGSGTIRSLGKGGGGGEVEGRIQSVSSDDRKFIARENMLGQRSDGGKQHRLQCFVVSWEIPGKQLMESEEALDVRHQPCQSAGHLDTTLCLHAVSSRLRSAGDCKGNCALLPEDLDEAQPGIAAMSTWGWKCARGEVPSIRTRGTNGLARYGAVRIEE